MSCDILPYTSSWLRAALAALTTSPSYTGTGHVEAYGVPLSQ